MDANVTNHIDSDPNRCGGKPCIAGTRIRVWDIYVAHEIRGEAPEQIVADYPHITLSQVHAALSYYWDHKAEIDAQMKEADRFVDELKAKTGSGPLHKNSPARTLAMLRFHLDEHVPHGVAWGLRSKGVDVTTTTDVGLVGADDEDHIEFARTEDRVIFTNDDDFLRHASLMPVSRIVTRRNLVMPTSAR